MKLPNTSLQMLEHKDTRTGKKPGSQDMVKLVILEAWDRYDCQVTKILKIG